MKTSVLLASAAVLALTAGSASAGAAHPGVVVKAPPAKHFTLKPRLGSTTLYNQDAGSDSNAIVSQNFTDSSFPSTYDAYGADDFVIPGTTKHKITKVFANGGYFGWPGPANSVTVVFYKKIKAGVAVLLKSCPSESYSDLSGSGAFLVDVSGCGVKIGGGKHRWVSAYVNMAFNTGGEWYWRTNINKVGKPSVWENPKNGFGTGCTTWTATQVCIPYTGVGPDFAFAILGN